MVQYNWSVATLGFLLCFLLSIPALSQNLSYDHVLPAEIDSVFAEFDKPDSPGCAVAVADYGELIFSRGYGIANLDYGIPIQPDSRFMIASISKQFAAASVLMMDQEGIVGLDSDVRNHLPELPEFEYTITPRHLINHTSGLRDIYNLLIIADIGLDNTTTVEEAIELVSRQQKLNFTPGSDYLYSNMGYFLISVLVERATGMTLNDYATRHFFEPSEMSDTHFHEDTEKIVENRVISYRNMSYGPGRFYRDNFDRVGARGLFTTVEDLVKWDRNFIENRTHLENFTERMTERGITLDGDTLDYAAGLRLGKYKMEETVGHGGSYMGFRTNYMRFPKHQFTVVTFCNRSNISPAGYSQDVADLYLKEVFEENFQPYTGIFKNESFGTEYELSAKDGDLYLKKGLSQKEVLEWEDKDEFSSNSWKIKFDRNGAGEIIDMKIQTPRTAQITFKKISS